MQFWPFENLKFQNFLPAMVEDNDLAIFEEPKWEGEGWYCLLQQSFWHLGFMGRDLNGGGNWWYCISFNDVFSFMTSGKRSVGLLAIS